MRIQDINKNENFVMTSVIGNYGNEIISKYTCAIMINVPIEISLKRIKKEPMNSLEIEFF